VTDLDRQADPGAPARFVARSEAGDIDGAVVVIDVLRAFTTAAYAFDAGARHIYLVADADEALAVKAAIPGALAMGEVHGRRPAGFDFANSPTEVAAADLTGRIIVQRTSAGTQGVVAARSATRLWCAGLVTASATATAVRASGLGGPAYVITGWAGAVAGEPVAAAPGSGDDDLATARLIERARLGVPLEAEATARLIAASEEAARTVAIGPGHSDPDDIRRAVAIDRFDFAMEVTRDARGLRLDRVEPG
jgi:2-phosphosulfolactate phosphatase